MSSWAQSPIRRALELGLAVVLLGLALPVVLVAAAGVAITSRGPVFFRQTRIGFRGLPFSIVKLRTLHDGQVTPLGRWLRRTSIDELPQIVLVLTGKMSLVGPRPLVEQDVARAKVESWRSSVRPGITGLVQVSGRRRLSWDHRFALDRQYVERASPGLDLWVLTQTVGAVWRSDEAD